MSDLYNNTKKNPKTPPILYVMVFVCLYFFYQAYSRFSIPDYFTGGFFLVVGIVLSVVSYITYKNNKG